MEQLQEIGQFIDSWPKAVVAIASLLAISIWWQGWPTLINVEKHYHNYKKKEDKE
jgi:hypothetical protein